MDVKSILDLKGDFVLTIVPEATIEEASEMLAENHIGAVVVTNDAGHIAGILSERDIAVALPQYGGALGETKVSEIMTCDVVFCTTETTVQEVLNIMVGNGIRHLPVVEKDKLIGVVSLRDVVGNWLGSISGDDQNAGDAQEPPMDPFSTGHSSAA
jgi:CBS domain-containing protein